MHHANSSTLQSGMMINQTCMAKKTRRQVKLMIVKFVRMEKIKNILVPLDGSKNSLKALTKAIFLAKKCNSSITALYVLHTAFDNPNLIYLPQSQNELKKWRNSLQPQKIR